jgi:methylmalonyl-CoA mutase N-terminal domain/subunit
MLYIDEKTAERQVSKLRELRRSRDGDAVRRALEALKRGAEGTDNTMPLLIDCARAYATLGEMCDALRDVWGEWTETPVI